MRPRILYELSRHLAVMLETSLAGERGARIPVLVCHPLDLEQDDQAYGKQATAVLYPTRVAPDTRWRPAGWRTPQGGAPVPEESGVPLTFSPLWVRVRYVFLIAGGSVEEQLEGTAAALRTLHENALISAEDLDRDSPASPPSHPGEGTPPDETESESYPLSILDDVEGWREIGLAEHALSIAFEVSVPIESSRIEVARRIVERELGVEEGAS